MTTFALARLAKRARIGHNALWLRAKSSPSKGKAMATGFDESDEIFDPDSASAAYDTRPPRRSPEMPIFSRVVLIIDMVLCGFRLAVVALGVVGYVVHLRGVRDRHRDRDRDFRSFGRFASAPEAEMGVIAGHRQPGVHAGIDWDWNLADVKHVWGDGGQ
jgi:hypothetical protein